MATPGGTITRQDLITDEALNWGPEHIKNVEKVIATYKDLANIAIEMNKNANGFRKVENQQQFIDAKQKQILLDQEALSKIKLLEAADVSHEKVRQEKLRTDKLIFDNYP